MKKLVLKPATVLKMNFLVGIFQGFLLQIHLVTSKTPIFKNTSFSQKTSSGCFHKKHSGTPSPDFFSRNYVVKKWMVPHWKIACNLIRRIIFMFDFNQILHFLEWFWSQRVLGEDGPLGTSVNYKPVTCNLAKT